MEHEIAKRASIAWFKLAECIERGEKERALNLHRLLMHSHGDQAYHKKLEADLVLFFDKDRSLDYYYQAATLYKVSGQHQELLFLYEHVIKIFPDVPELYLFLIDYCSINRSFKKGLYYINQLIELCQKDPKEYETFLAIAYERKIIFEGMQPGIDK